MTGPGQPRTCSHPIKARTLIGVCQAVRVINYDCSNYSWPYFSFNHYFYCTRRDRTFVSVI